MPSRKDNDNQTGNTSSDSSLSVTEDEKALVRHLARIAAEKDYKTFLKTGKIPYHSPSHQENEYD